MTKIQIKEAIDHNCHIRNGEPCGTFLALDPDNRVVQADYHVENTIPGEVFHGLEREYAVSPYLTAESLNYLMEKLSPLLERVCDAYYEEFNRQGNLVGMLNDDGDEAEKEIEQYIEQYEAHLDETDIVHVYDADDWFAYNKDEIKQRIKQGEKAANVVNDYLDICYGNLLIPDLDEYTEFLQEEIETSC